MVTRANLDALDNAQREALGAASRAVRARAEGDQHKHGSLWLTAFPAAYDAVMHRHPSWGTQEAFNNGVAQVALNALDGSHA